MTAMPEMVSLFNGMGGACAALISISEFHHLGRNIEATGGMGEQAVAQSGFILELVIIAAGVVIGAVSFAGSIIAWGKLNGKIKDFTFKGQHLVNLLVLGITIAIACYFVIAGPLCVDIDEVSKVIPQLSINAAPIFYILFGFALLYGVLFVLPFVGAYMHVVISLLKSF